jgi:Transcriptional regulators
MMPDNSLLQYTVKRIRSYILEGKLQPGEKLNVDGLARALNISKTPVRDAMNTLAAEKLVVYRPRRGYAVATMTVAEFLGLSELQEAIESHIYLRVAQGETPIDYDALEAINDEIVEAIAVRDAVRIFSINEDFHMAIYQTFPNKKMLERLREMWNELVIHRLHMFSSETFLATIPTDHRNIMDALKTRDTAKILAAVHTHFRNGNQAAVEILPDSPPSSSDD